MSRRAFAEANRLWFEEGRTARALDAYAEAHRAAPTDPVVAFQYARALWAVDRFDEARAVLDKAITQRARLDAISQMLLDQWHGILRRPLPEPSLGVPPAAVLDRDRLDADPSLVGNWRRVAEAAHERGMDGLAVYALDRWGGVPIDGEDARDLEDIASARDTNEGMLASMRTPDRPGTHRSRRPGSAERWRPGRDQPRPAGPPRRAPAVPAATRPPPASRPRPAPLPDLPLELTVQADPADGPVGVPTTLVARLRNVSPVEQVVNRRMLLNHPGAPGEILLQMQGPAGYRNSRGFRIRAGRAGNEFYVPLGPGRSLERSWRLDDYHSLDAPGGYTVTVTYHNGSNRAPDGRPVAVGKAVGTTRFQRR
jgi:hypothetical protein